MAETKLSLPLDTSLQYWIHKGSIKSDDASGLNRGHETMCDSEWSLRCGPDRKEKDSRVERRAEMEKGESQTESQSLVSSNCSDPKRDSESRDKWILSYGLDRNPGGPGYLVAQAFEIEKSTNVGFTVGRGRSSIVRPPSSGPAGSKEYDNSVNVLEKPSLSVETFVYPKGKLLDIVPKQKLNPTLAQMPGNLDDVPPISQLDAIELLAFVVPDAEQEAILNDMWNGKITSSGASYNSFKKGSPTECFSDPAGNGIIPLSPQWLNSKPTEPKMDTRGPSTICLGSSADLNQNMNMQKNSEVKSTTNMWVEISPSEYLLGADGRSSVILPGYEFLVSDTVKKVFFFDNGIGTLCGDVQRCCSMITYVKSKLSDFGQIDSYDNCKYHATEFFKNNAVISNQTANVHLCGWITEKQQWEIVNVGDEHTNKCRTMSDEIFGSGSGYMHAKKVMQSSPRSVDAVTTAMMSSCLYDLCTGGEVQVYHLKPQGEINLVKVTSLAREAAKSPNLYQDSLFDRNNLLLAIKVEDQEILSRSSLFRFIQQIFVNYPSSSAEIGWLHHSPELLVYSVKIQNANANAWFNALCDSGSGMREGQFVANATQSCTYLLGFPTPTILHHISDCNSLIDVMRLAS